jgi:AsmA protein
MLGRELQIEGPVSIQLWPSLQASAQNVKLANPAGFSEPYFATMKVMRTSVALLPLFSKRVEIKEFILVEPRILLEKRENGAVNWAIGNTQRAKTRANANAGFTRQPGALPLEASLGEIRLIDGDIKILDRVKDNTHHLAKVNMRVSMPALAKTMTAKGDLVLNGTPYSIDASLGGLKPFLEGQQTPLVLKLNSELFSISFDGAFEESTKLAAKGVLALNVPSVRKLAAFGGTDLAGSPQIYGVFTVSGNARINTKAFSFKNAKLRFDDSAASGSFGVVFAGARPKLSGNLDIPALDLTAYLPPAAQRAEGIAPWRATPFDLSMLKVVDSRFSLTLGSLKLRNIKIGSSVLETVLDNGRLQADLTKMALYGGQGTARVVVNAKGATPSFSLTADIADIAFQPLLSDAVKFKRLAGTGQANLFILSRGNSQAKVMEALSGKGNIQVKDGQIIGVNLAAVLRKAQSFLSTGTLPAQTNEVPATDFTDLSASFVIANGVARNDDFLMLAPVLRVPGEGTLDIGRQTVDFRLTPRAVASLEGQGGQADMVGFKAPFRIHGPWNDVKAGIDTKLLKKKAKKRLKKELGNLIGNNLDSGTGSALKSLLGVPDTSAQDGKNADGTAAQEKTDEEKAIDALSSLFKKKKKKKKNKN